MTRDLTPGGLRFDATAGPQDNQNAPLGQRSQADLLNAGPLVSWRATGQSSLSLANTARASQSDLRAGNTAGNLHDLFTDPPSNGHRHSAACRQPVTTARQTLRHDPTPAHPRPDMARHTFPIAFALLDKDTDA
ncbi:hypothetical protein JANAI62_34190 [Jannaschia pagri]|uniref:Uncharacterized protein n=1 Tax=Jannaschia pagri TaxID=2829797 RepID=A0ABQ4NR26_9RHOB|nr:hypothetical protein JANAI61_34190 [Jannaschia sp. AI_61]GIT96796.1 hypothetical protein JANAI62_34190 [Jannaschia sp. AI_62]